MARGILLTPESDHIPPLLGALPLASVLLRVKAKVLTTALKALNAPDPASTLAERSAYPLHPATLASSLGLRHAWRDPLVGPGTCSSLCLYLPSPSLTTLPSRSTPQPPPSKRASSFFVAHTTPARDVVYLFFCFGLSPCETADSPQAVTLLSLHCCAPSS